MDSENYQTAAKLLLLSSSSVHGMGYLEHVLQKIDEFLAQEKPRTLYFVPYALRDHDEYTAQVQTGLQSLGITVIGLHTLSDPRHVLEEADALFIGGGNSFRLLKTLQQLDLLDVVRRRVGEGTLRYMGSSAGTNMASPSLRTTNDMPIVQPSSFQSLRLVPFQINPHYIDADPNSTHKGETRELRINEFLEENDVAVLGLREGSYLHRDSQHLTLGGVAGARLFRRHHAAQEFAPGADLSWLLTLSPRFDCPLDR